MVLARPIEVGALRYVKTLALNCCVGANIVQMYFLLLYICIIMFFLYSSTVLLDLQYFKSNLL